jgi:ABC-type multidrug transport system fused ATPase/permease subunit
MGSGKTTIINLMARFYDIQKGEILIGGVNIKKYRIAVLRRNIYVLGRGRIEEKCDHDNLMNKNGVYRHLIELSLNEEIT